MKPRLIAVVGRRDTGKTTTMEYLVRGLIEKGFKVGAVKRIHDPGFSIDTPGKDTHRLSAAGATVVVSSADGEIATIKKAEKPSEEYFLGEIVKTMQREGVQVVLLEGFHGVVAKRPEIPKVVTARKKSDLDGMLRVAGGPVLAITGVIADRHGRRSKGTIPVVSLTRDGEKLLSMVLSALKSARE